MHCFIIKKNPVIVKYKENYIICPINRTALEAVGLADFVTTLASSSAVFIGAKIFISIAKFCSKKITNYF